MPVKTKRPHLAAYADWNYFADVEMPSVRFISMVRGALPDGGWADDEIDAVRDDVQFLFGKAVGDQLVGIQDSAQGLSTGLGMLEESLTAAAEILSSIGHLRTKEDSDLLSFIVKAASSASAVEAVRIENEIMECDSAINAMLEKVRVAREEFDALGGNGKPPFLWVLNQSSRGQYC